MPSRRLRTNARELTGLVVTLGFALWTVALVNTATGTIYLRSGQIRGTDFVQFYTLGRLAATGHVDRFDDFDAIRQTQLAAVPQATDVWFPPVYGPQVALVFAPLGHLSYGRALAVWDAISAALYFLACYLVITRTTVIRTYRRLALLAAAAFPAFWQLLQHGQLSSIALGLIVIAWLAMRANRYWWAGVLLGLLVYKPPLLVPILGVLLLAGEWPMLAGTIVGGTAEVLATGLWVGIDGVRRYILLTLHLPRMSTLLFTKPEQAHGLKAFWMSIVPQPTVALALYAISALVTVFVAARLWRYRPTASWRMMTAVLATSLAAPYLFVYDLTILAPVWIWLVDWYLSHAVPARVGRVLYLGYLAPLAAPLVVFIRVQPSVLCFAYLLAALWWYRAVACLPSVAAREEGSAVSI